MIELPAPLSPIRLALDNVVAALGAMSRANGYNLDYERVEHGYVDWSSEPYHDVPMVRVCVIPRPPDPPRTGERAGGAAFRWEDEIHCVVHARGDATNVCHLACCIREDLHRALFVDRSRGITRAWTGQGEFTFAYPVPASGGPIGVTVDGIVVVRWDHVAGDMTTN